MLKKYSMIFLFQILILFQSVFAQELIFAQDSVMSVMGSKTEIPITFSVAENGDSSKIVTVHSFSYKDKTVNEFSIELAKKSDSEFFVKNVVADSKEESTPINVIEALLSYSENAENSEEVLPTLFLKYKPGKMPFPIVLTKK